MFISGFILRSLLIYFDLSSIIFLPSHPKPDINISNHQIRHQSFWSFYGLFLLFFDIFVLNTSQKRCHLTFHQPSFHIYDIFQANHSNMRCDSDTSLQYIQNQT